MARLEDLREETFERVRKIKHMFGWKRGEAFERASTPRDEQEAAALGIFGPEANLTGNAIKELCHILNKLSKPESDEDQKNWKPVMYGINLIDDIFRSTGSSRGKRLQWTLETAKDGKEVAIFDSDRSRMPPQFYGDSDELKEYNK